MTTLTPSGRGTVVVNTVMLAVATLGVVLRFVAKSKARQPIALEDGLISFALLLFAVCVAITLDTMVNVGGTMEYADLTVPEINTLLKSIYVLEILMTLILTSVKLSVIFWYRNIFSTYVINTVNASTIVAGLLCIVWFLVSMLVLGYEVSNILIDVIILSIPLSVVRSLHLSTEKKFALGILFLLGGFVCVACILRVSYIYHPNDSTPVDIYRSLLWSTIELGVAILCACLPTLRPLVPRGAFTQVYGSYFKSPRNITLTSSAIYRPGTNTKFANSDTEGGRYLDLGQESVNLQQIS